MSSKAIHMLVLLFRYSNIDVFGAGVYGKDT